MFGPRAAGKGREGQGGGREGRVSRSVNYTSHLYKREALRVELLRVEVLHSDLLAIESSHLDDLKGKELRMRERE
eukprot:COSAG03_NODE_11664_length_581_cov_1.674274_2_plen_74_part_01